MKSNKYTEIMPGVTTVTLMPGEKVRTQEELVIYLNEHRKRLAEVVAQSQQSNAVVVGGI